ncbi:MAG: EF-hand domain-containing protein [Synechococcus sp.]|nr:EF-hand domain-containing protein [Synechococcus sp.]
MRQPAVPITALAVLLGLLLGFPLGSPAWASDEVEQYQQRMGQLFRQLDRNGDGRLDREDARANAYLQRHFDRLDRGGKGYLLPGDLR